MAIKDEKQKDKIFNPNKSIQRAKASKIANHQTWVIKIPGDTFTWSSRMDRVKLIRTGLPYETIEFVGKASNLSIKQLLQLLDMPQTTYNKRKRDKDMLSGRDSELILILTEVLEFGLNVFNAEEEKFQRWLQKPNIALSGAIPVSLFDSLTGIQEVRNSLNRLEYGNLA